jgi:hypothetical protein
MSIAPLHRRRRSISAIASEVLQMSWVRRMDALMSLIRFTYGKSVQ